MDWTEPNKNQEWADAPPLHINCRCVIVRINVCDWCGCASRGEVFEEGGLHPRCKTVKELMNNWDRENGA